MAYKPSYLPRHVYSVVVAGVNLYNSLGWWLDSKPSPGDSLPEYESLLVDVPWSSKQLDFSHIMGRYYHKGGSDIEYVLRCFDPTAIDAIVADEAELRKKLMTIKNVTVSDTWTGRVFDNCTITDYSAEFDNSGYECTVTFKVHTLT